MRTPHYQATWLSGHPHYQDTTLSSTIRTPYYQDTTLSGHYIIRTPHYQDTYTIRTPHYQDILSLTHQRGSPDNTPTHSPCGGVKGQGSRSTELMLTSLNQDPSDAGLKVHYPYLGCPIVRPVYLICNPVVRQPLCM